MSEFSERRTNEGNWLITVPDKNNNRKFIGIQEDGAFIDSSVVLINKNDYVAFLRDLRGAAREVGWVE